MHCLFWHSNWSLRHLGYAKTRTVPFLVHLQKALLTAVFVLVRRVSRATVEFMIANPILQDALLGYFALELILTAITD